METSVSDGPGPPGGGSDEARASTWPSASWTLASRSHLWVGGLRSTGAMHVISFCSPPPRGGPPPPCVRKLPLGRAFRGSPAGVCVNRRRWFNEPKPTPASASPGSSLQIQPSNSTPDPWSQNPGAGPRTVLPSGHLGARWSLRKARSRRSTTTVEEHRRGTRQGGTCS